MFSKKLKSSMVSVTALSLMLLGTFGTGVANAASGSESVGGGEWSWSTIPGVYAESSYYHRSVTHSASAQVGTGAVDIDVEVAGNTAKASALGVGTTRVWWSNNV